MIQIPALVTFANQKGGVGKTTLCVLFAHYLVAKGVRVRVFDCDAQLSIYRRRMADVDRYGQDAVTFPVEKCKFDNLEQVRALLGEAFNNQDYDVTLIDTPGNVTDKNTATLLTNSDILAIPFHYDKTTLSSTSLFIIGLEKHKRNLAKPMRTNLFLIPNLHDGRVGTRDELKLWDEARDTYSRYGTVTPKVSRKADMERYSTVMFFDQQAKLVIPVFDKIYYDMFDTLDPIRKTEKSESEQKNPDTPTLIEMMHDLAEKPMSGIEQDDKPETVITDNNENPEQ